MGTGYWQHHHDKAPSHELHLMQSFLAKHKITQVTQPLSSPDLVPCDFWLFPKLKSQGRDFRPLMRFRKIPWGISWWLGEPCEVLRCLLWRRLRPRCPIYNVSCIFFNKYLYFSYYMAGCFLDRPAHSMYYSTSMCVCMCIHIYTLSKFYNFYLIFKDAYYFYRLFFFYHD